MEYSIHQTAELVRVQHRASGVAIEFFPGDGGERPIVRIGTPYPDDALIVRVNGSLVVNQ